MTRLMILFAFLWGTSAAALELAQTGAFTLNRPASLEYDPDFCGLWIANEGPEAVLTTLDGYELRRIRSDMGRIKAIALEGSALIVADGRGNFQRLTKDGAAIAPPFSISSSWADTEGMVVDADGSIITVEDDPEYLSWLAPDGQILLRINTMSLNPPLSEAQGIARDPRTGHLLIVDDLEGTNSLYEFDANGTLLSTAPYWNTAPTPRVSRSGPARGNCSSPLTAAHLWSVSTTPPPCRRAPIPCPQARIAQCFDPALVAPLHALSLRFAP
ncbi:hypothetical protein OIU14_06210 [Thalassobacter stenotrophicus]|uniref:hypothetical protein n=1 Tax=Thalassobacter stenotrophicus TaxID=266809 RepID=UPI0022A8D606|nr:hypothetical protein [Thalassobacter stenotrophicus]UYP69318.1 hypothetical protein OIU14_06210 [Thalassobacter stenotrophicus]